MRLKSQITSLRFKSEFLSNGIDLKSATTLVLNDLYGGSIEDNPFRNEPTWSLVYASKERLYYKTKEYFEAVRYDSDLDSPGPAYFIFEVFGKNPSNGKEVELLEEDYGKTWFLRRELND